MGCSICLEQYDNDQEKGRRPVALPCGHIFHRACSDGWLKSCRMRNDPACCPLCKNPLGSARAQTLYPSDINDFDAYIANRNRRVERQEQHQDNRPVPATLALDRHLSRSAQGELLGKLMDFQRNINAYIMAVNNVSMSTYGPDDRIFRLFWSANKGNKEKDELFKVSVEALSEATHILNETIGSLEEKERDSAESNLKIREMREKIEQKEKSLNRHMDTKTREEQRMHEERSRVKRLELHLKKQMQELERDKERMEKERMAYMNEAREKQREARAARLESAQLCAQSRGDAQSEVESMKAYVLEQERLRMKAEEDCKDAKTQSSWLADRNKLLSQKLDAKRAELKRYTSKGQVKHEYQQSPVMGEPSPLKGGHRRFEEEEGVQWGTKGKNREADLLEDDGFVETGYKSALPPSEFESQYSSSDFSRGYPSLRSRSSRTKQEDEDDGGIVVLEGDIDAELDDGNYPMPGFHFGSSSSRRRPAAPIDVDGDDSVEIVDVKRRRISDPNNHDDLIQSVIGGGRLAFGPRQRAR